MEKKITLHYRNLEENGDGISSKTLLNVFIVTLVLHRYNVRFWPNKCTSNFIWFFIQHIFPSCDLGCYSYFFSFSLYFVVALQLGTKIHA